MHEPFVVNSTSNYIWGLRVIDDGEGPVTEDEAKGRAKEALERPEHKCPKGSPEDVSTTDDALDDPEHIQEGEPE